MRLRKRARSQAIDGLAGHTIGCAAAVPERQLGAEALRSRLSGTGAIAADHREIGAGEPLRELARQLDAMLSGPPGGQPQLGGEQEEIYAGGARDGETLIGEAILPDDIVVVSDPFAAVVAEAIREREALVLWQLELRPVRAAGARVWSFIQRTSPAPSVSGQNSGEP